MIFEIIDILVDSLQTVVGDSKRACRCVFYTTFKEHRNDGILKNLSIDIEIWNLRVCTEGSKDGVCRCAYTALERKELWWNNSSLHIVYKELSHVQSDLCCHRIFSLESTSLVRNVTLYNANNLFCVNLHILLSDAVCYVANVYRLTVRSIERFKYIV